MKTKAMKHQTAAVRAAGDREYFAYFMDMGTGKSWTLLKEAEDKYKRGLIDCLIITAPNGVHMNWILREIPAHLSVDYIARYWPGKNTSMVRRKALYELLKPAGAGGVAPLRILAINIEGLRTKDGKAFAMKLAGCTKAIMGVDESIRIKNHKTANAIACVAVGERCKFRRILNGSPTGGTPLDLYGQFDFLEPGLLGTTSYRAFVSEYAELLPEFLPPIDPEDLAEEPRRNPLYAAIAEQARAAGNRFAAPQVVLKDSKGRKRWRNIDKLTKMVAPHSFRVLKSECLDLPPKVYTNTYFELLPKSRAAYNLLEDDLRIKFGDEFITVAPLAAIIKLQQVTSGFVIVDGEPYLIAPDENPRMKAFLEHLEDVQGQFIVWARFTEEIKQIARTLRALGITCCGYYGEVKQKDRDKAVDDFQAGKCRGFIGQPQAGGLGLTLTAAQTVYYYSNDYNLITRQQSEDRAHRKGQTNSVLYVDLVAVDTKDEDIAASLQGKATTAEAISAGIIKNRG